MLDVETFGIDDGFAIARPARRFWAEWEGERFGVGGVRFVRRSEELGPNARPGGMSLFGMISWVETSEKLDGPLIKVSVEGFGTVT